MIVWWGSVLKNSFCFESSVEVITKYREKLLDLEPEVGEIMKMEAVEKKILSTENKVNRAQKQLAGEEETKRVWFQKKIERELTRGKNMFLVLIVLCNVCIH